MCEPIYIGCATQMAGCILFGIPYIYDGHRGIGDLLFEAVYVKTGNALTS